MEQMWTGFKSTNAEEDINGKYSIANSNEVDEFFQFPSVLHDREGYVQYLLNF